MVHTEHTGNYYGRPKLYAVICDPWLCTQGTVAGSDVYESKKSELVWHAPIVLRGENMYVVRAFEAEWTDHKKEQSAFDKSGGV